MLKVRSAVILSLFSLLCTAACSEVITRDSGQVCLMAEQVVNFSQGDALTITVVFENCVGGCAENIETLCEASVEGETITLDASATWEEPTTNQACDTSCRLVASECVVEDLAPGVYSIVGGDEPVELTLPSADIGGLECQI